MPNQAHAVPVVDAASQILAELRRGRDELARRVKAFSEDDLARQSACSEWDVAQVLSHLGSGAEIGIGTLRAAIGGEEPPGRKESEAIWTRWNAMSRNEHAASWLATTDRQLAGLEALQAADLARLSVPLSFLPAPLDAADFVAMRLNEQALHHWDVEVAFDDAAVIPESSAELLVDRMTVMMGWLSHADRWTGEPARIAVSLTRPSRDWTLSIADAVTIVEAPAADTEARLTSSSESFIRLTAGRLRDPDTSRVVITGPVALDDLVAVFPGF